MKGFNKFCLRIVLITLVVSFFHISVTDVFGQTLRIMPLGNSITTGVLGEPESEANKAYLTSYRQTLYNLLNSAGYDFDFVGHKSDGYVYFPDANHAGIPGSRDQYVVRLLQDGFDLRHNVHTTGGQPYLDVYPADLILLHIGTNDLTHEEPPIANSVSAILNEIDAWEARTGTDVTVIVARIINRHPYLSTTTEYNNAVASMVAARNDPSIVMVDMENGAGIDYETEMNPGDGLHPTQVAYDKMGQKWFEAIQALNSAPYFVSHPSTVASEDHLYTYEIEVADDNPLDNLTIIAGTLPSWCTFVDNGDKTGLISGTPGDTDVGINPVSLTVSDGKSWDTQDFNIIVSNEPDAPRITGQQSIATNEDVSLVLTKAHFTIEDTDTPMEDVELVVYSGNNYTYQGTTITPDDDYYGVLSVNVAAKDLELTGEIYKATVTVNAVNDAPELYNQINSLEVKEGSVLELKVSDFSYVDIDDNQNDLSVEVSSDPDEIFFINGNYIQPVADTTGMVQIGIRLDDGEDLSNEIQISINVLSAFNPPEFTSVPQDTVEVGELYLYLVEAIDPDEGDVLTYSSTVLPGWLQFNASQKLLGGSPGPEDLGTAWVGLEVSDGRYSVEQLYQVVVIDVTDTGDLEVVDPGLIGNIYPVPAREQVRIELNYDGPVILQLMDASAKPVIQQELDVVNGESLELDLGTLNAGIYYIRIWAGEEHEARRIIIRD